MPFRPLKIPGALDDPLLLQLEESCERCRTDSSVATVAGAGVPFTSATTR